MLDEVDRAVLAQLALDARASLRSLARATRLSVGTVGARLDRMVADGEVRVVGLVDPAALGQHLIALVVVEGDGSAATWAAVAALEQVHWLAPLDDLTSAIAQLGARDVDELREVVDGAIRPIPSVRRAHVAVGLRAYAATGLPGFGPPAGLPPYVSWAGMPTPVLDEADRALVGALALDGRAPTSQLAEAIGLSVPATRRRLRALLDGGALFIQVLLEPAAVGWGTQAGLGMALTTPAGPVVDALFALPEVLFVLETAGRFDLVAEVACADEERLREVVQAVRAIPGADAVELGRYRAVTKDLGTWS